MLDFSTVTRSGTRISANVAGIDWTRLESQIEARGLSLKRRDSIAEGLDEVCPVFMVEGTDGVIAEGKGLDADQAQKSALGEAVERVAGAGPTTEARKHIRVDSEQSLYWDKDWGLGQCTGPRDAYSPETLTEWLPAVNVTRNEACHLPAELAYFEYVPEETRTRLFSLHHTMGLAAGSSLEDAILSGIFEVLERDAYWITMRCRLNLPDIPLAGLAGLDPRVARIVEKLAHRGLRVLLKDMSLDWGIPIAHAVIVDENGGIPAFAHGTGASFDWPTSIARAVCESVQMYAGLDASMNAHFQWEDVVSVRGVLGDANLAWSDPLFAAHIEHIITPSSEKWHPHACTWTPTAFFQHLKELGHEVIAADLYSEFDLKVVRVFVTGVTQPDPRLERVGARLKRWLERTGLSRGLYSDPILT